MSFSAWSHPPGPPKFVTCRVAFPAPRTSTGTSSAGTYAGGSTEEHRADGRATSTQELDGFARVRTLSRPAYRKSLTAVNTLLRPVSGNEPSGAPSASL